MQKETTKTNNQNQFLKNDTQEDILDFFSNLNRIEIF